jgi:integrase
MARDFGRLTARQVANAKPPKGQDRIDIRDGGNLILQVVRGKEGSFSRSWLFAYQLAGRRRWMGLGGLHTVSLKEARAKARSLRQMLIDGIDPLDQRKAQRRALIAERAKAATFKADAETYIALHEKGWSAMHALQWTSSLKKFVYPKIGNMLVAEITSADVLRSVEPIWTTKNVTANRVLDRIALVLDYATAREHRQGDNPARSVRATLPKSSKVAQVENFAAVSYQEIGAVMAKLAEFETLPAIALRLTILCASRAGEVLAAEWSEFDFKDRTWTIPGSKMKGGREHRVPLSGAVLDLLKTLPRDGERVFPLDPHAMLRVLAKVAPGATVHGMRATFRTWVTEQTAFPAALAEAALAHVNGNKTEQAYARGDLFQKRRKLMQAWADHCAKPAATADKGKVVTLASARGA